MKKRCAPVPTAVGIGTALRGYTPGEDFPACGRANTQVRPCKKIIDWCFSLKSNFDSDKDKDNERKVGVKECFCSGVKCYEFPGGGCGVKGPGFQVGNSYITGWCCVATFYRFDIFCPTKNRLPL
jgi:hypothetical protein